MVCTGQVILVVLDQVRDTCDDFGVRTRPIRVRDITREITPEADRVERRGRANRDVHQRLSRMPAPASAGTASSRCSSDRAPVLKKASLSMMVCPSGVCPQMLIP